MLVSLKVCSHCRFPGKLSFPTVCLVLEAWFQWFFGGTDSEAAPFSTVVVFSCGIGGGDQSHGEREDEKHMASQKYHAVEHVCKIVHCISSPTSWGIWSCLYCRYNQVKSQAGSGCDLCHRSHREGVSEGSRVEPVGSPEDEDERLLPLQPLCPLMEEIIITCQYRRCLNQGDCGCAETQ